MPVSDPDVSRPRLIRDGSFLENDWREIAQRRRAHNRLGFAYQVAFVRVLGRFPQQEPLEIDGEILRFAALQLGADPGRALKTEFLLQYMSEPQLRAKVRRGLLKVEQLHALARAVYYGQRGRISAREVYGQMNACSCLTLILVCIVYWQTREISRIAAAPNFPFNPELNQVHVYRLAISEAKDDSPIPRDAHAPLSATIPFELVQPPAGQVQVPWRTCILQCGQHTPDALHMVGVQTAGVISFMESP